MKGLFRILWCLKSMSSSTTSHCVRSQVSYSWLSLRKDISNSSFGRSVFELLRLGPRTRWQDPECAVLLDPGGAFVAQQGAANLAGIVAQADADHLKTFRMLVAAEQVRQKVAHAVDNRL